MPSPFPGMDPYIEQPSLWGDFHNNLASAIQFDLNPEIRPNYFARLIPYVTYETVTIGQVERTYPDVSIFRPSSRQQSNRPTFGASVAVLDAPMTSQSVESEVEVDFPLRLHSVEVRSVIDGKLVTVIEILSPVNKKVGHPAFDDYRRKRQQILNSNNVHLLEIDLLRGGQRPALARPVPDAAYYVMLSRTETRPKVTVWPIQLQERLPIVPVPLLAPDADVALDLGTLVAAVYDRGSYDLQIDYNEVPPSPKLSEAEFRWMRQIIPQKTN